MSTLGIVLLVAFIIVCILLILLVVIQDDGENGMGGLLGGRGTAAFGSHSASVLTKTTRVFVILFFLLAAGLAFVTKKSNVSSDILDETVKIEETVEETKEDSSWWKESAEATTEQTSESTESTEATVTETTESTENTTEVTE